MTDYHEKNINHIVELYGLRLKFAEKYGRVHKLYTDKGTFALKKINAKHGVDFLQYIQLLYQRGYHRIVPIYPTMDGRYGVLVIDKLYYLMPWLENREREGQIKKSQELFRELARLHTISAREVDVAENDRKEHFDLTSTRWEKEKEALEQYVERAEQAWYMSPFQLLFCTFYHEVTMAQNYSIRKFNEWYDVSKEQTKARSVIVHGKISPEHFLYNEQGTGYFTNFESAMTASPIHDLLPFLSRSLKTYPKRFDDGLEWLSIYFRHFPFRKDEMLLFLSYLAYPERIFQVVDRYFAAGKERNEYKFVRQLQKQYWYMKNTEYIVMSLEEMEQRKNEAGDPPPS
ncbi:spore coat protein YsxE [Siminovitchia acidinfaciens]|uniref:Spore coat protein YsxE n=1 Tax=Siminovitchia acidinfaciens TaxID=2321395 RepID=A0A429Y496_9BACI|nr:spore coat protein YsxE [Siminovitchia acidinfaciens]RST76230.1 spore coat protein YsxE [Siminovitchia acidinfaciens]